LPEYPARKLKTHKSRGLQKPACVLRRVKKRVPVICWGNQTKMLGREQQGCHKECNPKHLLQLSGLDETLDVKRDLGC